MESREVDYQKEWEEYRKRKNTHYLIFGASFLFYPLAMFYFRLIGLNERSLLLQLFLFAIISGFFVWSSSKFNSWLCPSCKKPFFTYSFWATDPTMIDECRNCHLPKYFGSSFYKSKKGFFPKIKEKA